MTFTSSVSFFFPSFLFLVLVFYCCLTKYHKLADWKNSIILCHHSAGHSPAAGGMGAHCLTSLVSQSWNQAVSWLSSYPKALRFCRGAHSSCGRICFQGLLSLFSCWMRARGHAQLGEVALRSLVPEHAPSLCRSNNKIPLSCQIIAASKLCVFIRTLRTSQKQNRTQTKTNQWKNLSAFKGLQWFI